MDLRQVEYALAIVDHGGFTRAADALHVAQPSLSQSIRRLEVELGAPLFVRHGRQVRLSPAGEAFVGPARRLLRDASTVRGAVAAHGRLLAGRLDIVALPTLVVEPLVGFIGSFRHLHPGVTVHIVEPKTARQLVDMVRDGRCEVGFTESVDLADGLAQITLRRQRLLAVLPTEEAEHSQDALDLGALAELTLILTPAGTSIRDLVDDAFASIGTTPRIGVETGQRDAIVPLVLAGAGATVLPESMAVDAQMRGATVRPLRPELSRSIGVIHPTDGMSPAATAFVAMVAASIGTDPPAQSSRRARAEVLLAEVLVEGHDL